MTTQEDWEYLQYRIYNEGFHYCFRDYSDFEEIVDEEFHKLRKEYLKISEKLENYINQKIEKYEES
jgi:hypothetical protein